MRPLHCSAVLKHCVTSVHMHVCRREGKGVVFGVPEVRDQLLFHPYFDEILKKQCLGM